MMTTLNMLLTLPSVGPGGTQGPDWAIDLVNDLQIIDYHNHIPGRGTTLSNNSIQIQSSFDIKNYQIKEIASLALINLGVQSTQVNLIYDFNGEFYFNDKNGNKIQLTNLGNINVSSIAGVTGDYTTSSADLSYSIISKSFIFKQTALLTANTEHGPIKIYRPVLGSGYAQIKQDDAQSIDLDFTWPSFLPVTSQVIRSDSSGVLNPSELQSTDLTNGLIIQSKLAADSIETTSLKNGSVTRVKRSPISNYAISLNCGIFSSPLNQTSFVPNLSINLTTLGAPVQLGLRGDNELTSLGGEIFQNQITNPFFGYVVFYRDATPISSQQFRGDINTGGFTWASFYWPASMFTCFDAPPAGTYNYRVAIVATNVPYVFQNIKLYAFEV